MNFPKFLLDIFSALASPFVLLFLLILTWSVMAYLTSLILLQTDNQHKRLNTLSDWNCTHDQDLFELQEALGKQSELLLVLQQHNQLARHETAIKNLVTDTLRDHIRLFEDWNASMNEDICELSEKHEEVLQTLRIIRENDRTGRHKVQVEYLRRDLRLFGDKVDMFLDIDLAGRSYSPLPAAHLDGSDGDSEYSVRSGSAANIGDDEKMNTDSIWSSNDSTIVAEDTDNASTIGGSAELSYPYYTSSPLILIWKNTFHGWVKMGVMLEDLSIIDSMYIRHLEQNGRFRFPSLALRQPQEYHAGQKLWLILRHKNKAWDGRTGWCRAVVENECRVKETMKSV